MKVRLKTNVIIGKEFISRGTVVDSDILAEHLQTPEVMDADISLQQGKVLLLHGLIYTSLAGDGVNYPITLSAGELISLREIPPRQLEGMVDGRDYLSDWNQKDRDRVLAQVQKEHERAFSFDNSDIPLRGGRR